MAILLASIPMCTAEDVDVLLASAYSNQSDDLSIRGTYEFTSVPDGTYTLIAVKDMSEINSGMAFHMEGTQITVVNGAPVVGANITLDVAADEAYAAALKSVINSSSLAALTGSASISGVTIAEGHAGFTPVRGCDVGLWQAMDLPDGIIGINVSDSNGDYSFSDIPDGNYVLESAKWLSGMGSWEYGTAEITITEGEIVTENVLMNFVYDNETIAVAQSIVDTSDYILCPTVGNGSISGKIQMEGMSGSLTNIANAIVILCEAEAPEDWNPWNDTESEGIPDGSYITINEVIDAYNCFKAEESPAGTLITINHVIDMYNAFKGETPM
nr:carboxypeptidase-like regulatory domain-containing protein [uncultured Methanolobus sp.]